MKRPLIPLNQDFVCVSMYEDLIENSLELVEELFPDSPNSSIKFLFGEDHISHGPPNQHPSPPHTPLNNISPSPHRRIPHVHMAASNPAHLWFAPDAVSVPGDQHDLSKHPDKYHPCFDPDNNEPLEDHLKAFMMSLRIMQVQDEDVVCKLFPHTFMGKAAIWYYSLAQGSIASWNQFKEAFLEKYGEEKTPAILVLELSRMKVHDKKRVKDFNQRFNTLLSKIPQASQPV